MIKKNEIPGEVLDLLVFMCETWSKIDRFVYEECPGSLMKYPVIQGTRNQLNINKIGEQGYKKESLQKAVDYMLSRKEME